MKTAIVALLILACVLAGVLVVTWTVRIITAAVTLITIFAVGMERSKT